MRGVAVARYAKDLVTGLSRAEAKHVISSYLTSQGFAYSSERGEMVWRRGTGTLAAPQFVKAEPADSRVHIEAWIPAFSFLPGVHAGEQGLGGPYGWVVKTGLRARVAELEAKLTGGRAGEAVTGEATVPAVKSRKPAGWYPDPIGKHVSRYWDGTMWTTHVADGSHAPSGTSVSPK